MFTLCAVVSTSTGARQIAEKELHSGVQKIRGDNIKIADVKIFGPQRIQLLSVVQYFSKMFPLSVYHFSPIRMQYLPRHI